MPMLTEQTKWTSPYSWRPMYNKTADCSGVFKLSWRHYSFVRAYCMVRGWKALDSEPIYIQCQLKGAPLGKAALVSCISLGPQQLFKKTIAVYQQMMCTLGQLILQSGFLKLCLLLQNNRNEDGRATGLIAQKWFWKEPLVSTWRFDHYALMVFLRTKLLLFNWKTQDLHVCLALWPRSSVNFEPRLWLELGCPIGCLVCL